MQVGGLAPALDRNGAQFAGGCQFGETRARGQDGHAEIIGKVLGCADAVGARGDAEEFAVGFERVDLAGVVFGGNQALGEVEDAGEIGAAFDDAEEAAHEVRFEHGARHGADPGAGDAAGDTVGSGERVGAEGAKFADLLEHPGSVLRVVLHDALEAPGTDAAHAHPGAQQGPGGDGDDGGFMRPLFGELAAAIHHVVEARAGVGA